MLAIAEHRDSDYLPPLHQAEHLVMGYLAMDRFVQLARDSKAGMAYSDYYTVVEGNEGQRPRD